MISQAVQRYLDAMTTIESISAALGTTTYIWGGWTLDIYKGRLTRAHADVDCFVVDLHPIFDAFSARLLEEGWQVRNVLGGHLLWAERDGVKLHLGHVEIDDRVVNWKHNGEDGSILFPAEWLAEDAVEFLGVQVHVVEPEFGYVLKTHPHLMNPAWVLRDKDRADIEALRTLLEGRVDLDSLRLQVRST